MVRRMKEEMKKIQKIVLVCGVSMCLSAMCPGGSVKTALAETEPTFNATQETSVTTPYIATVNTENLNVRIGYGGNFDQLRVDGKLIILHEGDQVAVFESGTSPSGYLWYEIRWMEDGLEYHGYVRGKYLDLSEEVAMPLVTPTPTSTPTPTATPTPEATPTPVITQGPAEAPSMTPVPTQAPEKNGILGTALKGIGLVLFLLLLAAAVYVVIMKRKKENVKAETAEKIDSLKNIQLDKGQEEEEDNVVNIMRRRPEPVSGEVKETPSRPKAYESDATMLARKEHARVVNEEIMERSRFYDPNEEKKKQDELKQLSKSLKEKELLRDEIDNLIPGELVYHEYFGKGVVFDNSDVKVIEIRFGTDVRFINKASCVAKKLMRKV